MASAMHSYGRQRNFKGLVDWLLSLSIISFLLGLPISRERPELPIRSKQIWYVFKTLSAFDICLGFPVQKALTIMV